MFQIFKRVKALEEENKALKAHLESLFEYVQSVSNRVDDIQEDIKTPPTFGGK